LDDLTVQLAVKIGEKVLKLAGRECYESIFEYLACWVLALKLRHSLQDGIESMSIVDCLKHALLTSS